MAPSAVQRILIVYNRVPYPLKDGGAMAMYTLLQSWLDSGKEVHLLAMNTSRHYVDPAELPPLFKRLASCRLVDVDNRIHPGKLLRNLFFSTLPEHAERFYQPVFVQALEETLEQVKPDMVQLESIYLHSYLPHIRQHSNARVIQRLHNIEHELWQRTALASSSPLKRYYLSLLSKRVKNYELKVWQESDALVPISHQDAAFISPLVKKPMHTLPFGIDISAMPEPKQMRDFHKAYHLGAMDWLPNQEAVIWFRDRVLPSLRQVLPQFEFHFAGRNMPDSFVSDPDKGFFCHGEVPDAMAFATDKPILLVPLHAGSGIRIKTLEGMACGKLVISTTVGMQGIEAEVGRHFLEANTAEAFVEAICWALQHPDQACVIAQNARALVVQRYDQNALMQSYLQFVEKLA